MACERYEALIRFHDGDLQPAETAEFRKHLHACCECRSELHLLQETEGNVRDVVRRALPTGTLGEKVVRRIQQENIRISAETSSETIRPAYTSFASILKLMVPALAILFLVFAVREKFPQRGPSTQGRSPSITALAFSDQEMIEGKQMTPNQPRPFPIDQPVKIRERLALSWLEGRQTVEIIGQASIRCNQQRLSWEAGDAEIRFTLVEPVLVGIGGCELTITGTRIHLRGNATDSVVVTLLEGHVTYRTPSGTGEMIPGTPLLFGKNACSPAPGNPLTVETAPRIHPPEGIPAPVLSTPADRINPFEGNPVNGPGSRKEQ